MKTGVFRGRSEGISEGAFFSSSPLLDCLGLRLEMGRVILGFAFVPPRPHVRRFEGM